MTRHADMMMPQKITRCNDAREEKLPSLPIFIDAASLTLRASFCFSFVKNGTRDKKKRDSKK
jgi:hypothetical protein